MGKMTFASAPDHLTMNLFAPGMSLLHRAGLGGLACTLKAFERQHAGGKLRKSDLPHPFIDGAPPWEVSKHSVTLRFGEPNKAEEYLKRLFTFAFGLRKDGLISLPGQFESEPAAAVLADLQSGLTLTFLQHGQVRKLAEEPTIANYDLQGHGVPAVTVQYRACSRFKHQKGWQALVDGKGCLVRGPIKVDGPISPGTVVRHVQFTADTAAEDPPERMLPLYFALVGCLALPVNRGVAALLVPEVDDLLAFVIDRRLMSPITAKECQIANAADAALQAQVRLRGKRVIGGSACPGCYAMTFTPTAWASQQKSRVATIHIPPGDDKILDRFARALACLPLRIATRTIKEKGGKGKKNSGVERTAFRSDSIVRPIVAENLALGRPWYAGFGKLMTKSNPATGKPYRNQLAFERKGLHDMISDPKMWDQDGEALVVHAIHEAIRNRYGRIAAENQGKPAAMQNRWKRFREKLRLDLCGAKTSAHVRYALTDLFSRGGSNAVLQEQWAKVLPILRCDWQLARDLGLLALASYAGKGDDDSTSESSTLLQPETDT
jgi:CRISPR-associated protein Cas8a1/Csx13